MAGVSQRQFVSGEFLRLRLLAQGYRMHVSIFCVLWSCVTTFGLKLLRHRRTCIFRNGLVTCLMAAPFTSISSAPAKVSKRQRTASDDQRNAVRPIGLQSGRKYLSTACELAPSSLAVGTGSLAVRPLELGIQCVGTPPAESGASWWIQKVWSLTP